MTKSSSTNTSSSTSTPWATAMPEVNGLLGQLGSLIPNSGVNGTEQGAINQLTANAEAGNPYAGAIGNAATNLLNGGNATAEVPQVQQNFQNAQTALSPYLNPNYSTVNSPAVQSALQQIGTDTTNQINSQFAAAGRSGSGMEAQTLGRGIAQAEAPLILNQANQDTQNRLAAENNLYGAFGAGNAATNAIARMYQQGAANQQAGIGAAGNALSAENWGPEQILAAQEQGQSLPAQNLGLLANSGIPLANLGRTNSGTSTTTSNPSLLSSIVSVGNMLSNFIPKAPGGGGGGI